MKSLGKVVLLGTALCLSCTFSQAATKNMSDELVINVDINVTLPTSNQLIMFNSMLNKPFITLPKKITSKYLPVKPTQKNNFYELATKFNDTLQSIIATLSDPHTHTEPENLQEHDSEEDRQAIKISAIQKTSTCKSSNI